jgi:hypothetical protein
MNSEEIEKIKQHYLITAEEFEEMYLQAKKITFANYKPTQSRPIAIFTGGQPGAGKSGLILKTKREFAKMNKDLIVFDLDMYRALYKNSFEIAKIYPDLYSEITAKSSGKIMERLSMYAIKNGYNFILEGTMGKSIDTLDLLQNNGADYDVVARLLAVSREESLLSIFERYIEMKKNMGIGRMTAIESHDKKYSNFLNIAGTLETRGVEVEVYERSNEIANPKMTYKTSSENRMYNSVIEALIAGRNNSKKICMKNSIERLQSIKSDLKEFGEIDKYKKQIEILSTVIEKENTEIERD